MTYFKDHEFHELYDTLYDILTDCIDHNIESAELNLSIRKGGELDLLLEHGIIKERLSALMTDAIRAAVLESEGYETDVIEFIDFEHSPKNLMLRARYTGKRRPGGREQAEKLRATYGFAQTLLDLTEKS